jgi:hypothetical protein
MVTSSRPEILVRLRELREENFQVWRKLSFWYGVLRRADFAANSPRFSRMAEHAGRWLERRTGLGDGNFYDAGRYDAALAAFAARRARRVLANLPAVTAQRQQILRQLTEALQGAGQVLLRPQPDPGDAAAFLLVKCGAGGAEHWVEQAGRGGVTLRRCWPAYQHLAPAQASGDLIWLAEHLLLLELHPRLSGGEIARIAHTLGQLGANATAGRT